MATTAVRFLPSERLSLETSISFPLQKTMKLEIRPTQTELRIRNGVSRQSLRSCSNIRSGQLRDSPGHEMLCDGHSIFKPAKNDWLFELKDSRLGKSCNS